MNNCVQGNFEDHACPKLDQCKGNGWVKRFYNDFDTPEGLCPPWACYNSEDNSCNINELKCPTGYVRGDMYKDLCQEQNVLDCPGANETNSGWFGTSNDPNLHLPQYKLKYNTILCPPSSCYNPTLKKCIDPSMTTPSNQTSLSCNKII